jgi:hypothetical protein
MRGYDVVSSLQIADGNTVCVRYGHPGTTFTDLGTMIVLAR